MPERIKGPTRLLPVSPALFEYGSGMWSFYNNPSKGIFAEPVHEDKSVALAHWQQVRREVWAAVWRFKVPGAAEFFDGLTHDGRDLIWNHWGHSKRDCCITAVLAALAEDRANVAAFRKNDPAGAADIADYLEIFLQDLDYLEKTALLMVDNDDGVPHRDIESPCRYGDEPRVR